MDYRTTVTAIGDMVSEFMKENILIVYNDNSPQELRDLAVCHTAAPLDKEVSVGDVVVLGNKDYVVTAVGSEANETLRKMGHCTLSFAGKDTADLPGYIELEGDGMPEVKVGERFEIIFT